jgi:hypothetical protein
LIEPDLGRRYTSTRDALRDIEGRTPFHGQAPSPPVPGPFDMKLEVGGVSLFRVFVGVALGAIIGWLVLVTIRDQRNREAETTIGRGIDAQLDLR